MVVVVELQGLPGDKRGRGADTGRSVSRCAGIKAKVFEDRSQKITATAVEFLSSNV